ncbi:pentapeptide repeat-containing protein [Desulfobotulus mexicanus]|uniref:NACHT-associated inactive Restriction Endonuclease 2 domain-containing protein n=1 Tax=Desulfobotulus mexicanus TaxID=2586642 RepID=A0A5S5MFA2_9BACT|nr:pentapeptide repeat-containing protein [Desulfobotulus mexicanus]TYT74368.1 hypothetical protein FIM25_10425 [Desulfobotulus mexicanus]
MSFHIRTKILDNAYLKYGFTVFKTKYSDVRVYTIQQGHFYNAEIVPLISNANIQRIEHELQSIGYSTRVQKYSRDADAHQTLFDVFFQILPSRNRLLNLCRKFKTNQTKYLGFDYSYVPAPFEVESSSISKIGEKEIIETIASVFSEDGPHIVFLEAAAGFGKTCTAVEILSWILTHKNDVIPIFTELSRNRGARIFRYVLLDEIDRNFTLPSIAVTDEIRHGRIPLIVDGFDELLTKKSKDSDIDDDFLDSEPMLDTIASLLQNQAKILVTTRRTAVFTSQNFEEWVERLEAKGCSVHRIILQTPRIDDWLGKRKKKKLQNSGVPIEQLSNPVLLSFLEKQSEEYFNNICSNPDEIVNFYFKAMLLREKKRQDLRIEPEDQILILKSIASSLLKQDITMDTPDSIRSTIYNDINNVKIINKACDLYIGSEKVNIDEVIDKLLVHALLDRVPIKNLIGFINDFILGTLQGELISEGSDYAGSDGQIDRIVTAFSAQSKTKRKKLWDMLELVRLAGEPQLRLIVDLNLLGRPNGLFENATFEEVKFENISFAKDSHFSNCTFSKCIFSSCIFELNFFSNDIGFCECIFRNCSNVVTIDANAKFWERGCLFNSSTSLEELFKELNAHENRDYIHDLDLSKDILERFWPPGRPNATLRKRTSTLYKGTPPNKHRLISKAIEELVQRELLLPQKDNSYILNIKENYDEIKTILTNE